MMGDWCADTTFGIDFLSGDIVEDKDDSVNDKLFKSSSTHVWIVRGKDSYFTLWSGQRENTKSMVNASYYFEWKKTIRALNSIYTCVLSIAALI